MWIEFTVSKLDFSIFVFGVFDHENNLSSSGQILSLLSQSNV